jgi:hypothetical protein
MTFSDNQAMTRRATVLIASTTLLATLMVCPRPAGAGATPSSPPTSTPPAPPVTLPPHGPPTFTRGGPGGGTTTTTAPGTIPPPPPAPPVPPAELDALVGSLRVDLGRLNEIGKYTTAKQAVTAAQAAAAGANAGAAQSIGASQAAASAADAAAIQAKAAQLAAGSVADAARADIERTRHALSSLAVALYVHDDVGLSSRPADPSSAEADRTIMLALLLGHEKDGIRAARRHLADAERLAASASAAADRAAAGAASADAGLAQTRAGQTQTVTTANAGLAKASAALAAALAAFRQLGPSAAPDGQAASRSSPSTTSPSKSPPRPPAPPPAGPPILGPTALTAAEMAGWFGTTGYAANTTAPMTTLAGYYVDAAKAEGVASDVAFAQSILETGYFTFPSGGQVAGTDNNFAGIGACDTCTHGLSFPDAQTGVRAQLQLLHAYASTQMVATPLIGDVTVAGCCPTWLALTGVWATSTSYGYAILRVYQKMVEYALPLRATAAGL